MSYTQNTLATAYYLASGSLKCYLYIDDSISPALTVPTTVNITSISPVRESVDIKAGEVDLGYVTVDIVDDYTTYTDGFWWTLIEGNPTYNIQMMFILTENGTDTYLFRGSISRENTHWTEYYASDPNYVRSVSIQLVSPMLLLKNISITSMLNYLALHHDSDDEVPYFVENYDDELEYATEKYIKLGNVINNMMELAFASDTESYQVVVRGADILFYDTKTTSYKNPFELYLLAQIYDTSWYYDHLFGCVEPHIDSASWYSRFDNCWELLVSICLSLGIVPRYYWGDSDGIYQGDANDKHTIEILCRGDRTTTALTNTSVITPSKAISNSPNKYLDIITRNLASVDDQLYAVINGSFYTADPENTIYEMELNSEFTSDLTETIRRTFHYGYVAENGKWYFVSCTKCEYWEHTSDAFVSVSFENGTNALLEVLTKYLFYRFSSGRREYEREYGTLGFSDGATTTHQHLKILARHEIDSVAYYAVGVEKDILTNRAKVNWVME